MERFVRVLVLFIAMMFGTLYKVIHFHFPNFLTYANIQIQLNHSSGVQP